MVLVGALGKLAVISPALEIGQLLTSLPAHTRVGIVRRVRIIREKPNDLRLWKVFLMLKIENSYGWKLLCSNHFPF